VKNIPSEISEEMENKFRLQLLRSLIKKTLRAELHKHFDEDPGILCQQLKARKKDIDSLLEEGTIGHGLYNLLLPQNGGSVYSESFGVSPLVIMLQNLCGYSFTTDWIPEENEKSVKANIHRCIAGLDRIQDSPAIVLKKDMDDIFNILEQPLLDLDATQMEFNRLKTIKIIDSETKSITNELEVSNKQFHYGCKTPVPNFFSRDDELQELHKLMENSFDEADFTNHKMGVVISGMEGIGKSQLVRQYWKIHQENFFSDHCIWINGHSEATMANDFRAIGELCDMPKNSDGAFTKQSEIVSWVYRHFAKREDNNSSTKKVGVLSF